LKCHVPTVSDGRLQLQVRPTEREHGSVASHGGRVVVPTNSEVD
jgi:hypothetical protein